jgi:multisubunit Na+/H+ antiporter MnhE subunit
MRLSTLWFWLAETAILFCVWLIYTWRVSMPELLAGVGAAMLAATGAEAVRGLNFAGFYPLMTWILEVRRLPYTALEGCARLVEVLALRYVLRREVRGGLRTVRFDPGGDDARSAARRALAVALVSFAPNSIVVHIDRERGVMIYHQIIPTTVPKIARRLGARP